MKISLLSTGLWANIPRRHGQTFLTGAAVLLGFVALWAVIQFSTPNLAGNDDYFHIKFAQVMRQQGVRPAFVWLPLTILKADTYADHHFLYHVLLIPFTGGDLRIGAKWAAVIFAALAFFMGWIVLRGQNVPLAALWALGFFAVSDAFLFRLSMVRVQAVSLLALLLALHWLLTGRHRRLLPLAFTYAWLYDALPLLLGLVGMYVLAVGLVERKLNLAPLWYAGLGGVLGLLINPYFPNNVIFIYHHYLPKLTDLATADIDVGNEWYAYSTWALAKNSGPTLLALAAAALALGLRDRRMDTATAVLFMVTLFFGVLLLKSRRFIEYFPAFALIFCAVAWKPLLLDWRRRARQARLLPLVLALLLLPLLIFTVRQVQTTLGQSSPYQQYAAAATWLQNNSAPGSIIFQSDWDDFCQLFFYNTANTYTLGLDPTYMALANPQLYQVWRDTTNGWGNIGPVIKTEFNARFAITDLKHSGFLDKADLDPYLKRVYQDEFAVIFQVMDQPDPAKKSWYN